jgi:zinc finger SWIM domain-containing protein 3
MKILPLRKSTKLLVILQTKPVRSCGQFNRIGILCGHALKVLDLMNIKSLSAQYILRRWTREARSGTVQDNQGRNIIENPKLDDMLRYENMTRKFLNLAYRAASHPRCTLLMNNTIDMVNKQVQEEINNFSSAMDPVIVPTNVAPPIDLVSTASLKKKEVETKTSKRKRNCLDKKRKIAKKGGNKKRKGSNVCNNTKYN